MPAALHCFTAASTSPSWCAGSSVKSFEYKVHVTVHENENDIEGKKTIVMPPESPHAFSHRVGPR